MRVLTCAKAAHIRSFHPKKMCVSVFECAKLEVLVAKHFFTHPDNIFLSFFPAKTL